jgi:hypothetical protein
VGIGGSALYFRISSKSVKLVELEDVTSFHAVCPAGLGQRELAEIVGNEDLGEVLPAGPSLWTRYGGWRPAGSALTGSRTSTG